MEHSHSAAAVLNTAVYKDVDLKNSSQAGSLQARRGRADLVPINVAKQGRRNSAQAVLTQNIYSEWRGSAEAGVSAGSPGLASAGASQAFVPAGASPAQGFVPGARGGPTRRTDDGGASPLLSPGGRWGPGEPMSAKSAGMSNTKFGDRQAGALRARRASSGSRLGLSSMATASMVSETRHMIEKVSPKLPRNKANDCYMNKPYPLPTPEEEERARSSKFSPQYNKGSAWGLKEKSQEFDPKSYDPNTAIPSGPSSIVLAALKSDSPQVSSRGGSSMGSARKSDPVDGKTAWDGADLCPPPNSKHEGGFKSDKTWETFALEGGRSVKEVKERGDGFSGAEISKLHRVFACFTSVEQSEADKGTLEDMAQHLGFLGINEDVLDDAIERISEFSTFEFEEVVSIFEYLAAEERNILTGAFEQNAGEEDALDFPGLIVTLRELGIMCSRVTVIEFLGMVGLDTSDMDSMRIEFKDFIDTLAVYRVTEGFSTKDRGKARIEFDKHQLSEKEWISLGLPTLTRTQIAMGAKEQARIKITILADCLVETFGFLIVDQLQQVIDHVTNSISETVVSSAGTSYITFIEFLSWARCVREAAHKTILEKLQEVDGDADGEIDRDELFELLQNLGFTVFNSTLEEMFVEASVSDLDSYDLDAVLAVCRICHRRAGFRTREIEELSDVFKHFDSEGTGEIRSERLVALLRHMGYSTSAEDVHRFLQQVDANGNGAMDLAEFLRAMRMHSEEDLKQVQEIFNRFKGSEDDLSGDVKNLSVDQLGVALAEITEEPVEEGLLNELASFADEDHAFSFEAFADAASRCRKLKAEVNRKRANFKVKDFDACRKLFDKRVKPGSKELEKGQLLFLLMDLNVAVSTADERKQLFIELDQAKKNALEAGVDPEEVGQTGCPTSFWVLIHFLYLHKKNTIQNDAQSMEQGVIDETRFSKAEVKEFRDLFNQWCKAMQVGQAPAPAAAPSADRMTRRSSLPTGTASASASASAEPESNSTHNMRLPVKGMRLLLESIGLDLSSKDKSELDKRILTEHRADSAEEPGLDFPRFLLIMRWALDTNFAGMNSVAEKAAVSAKLGIACSVLSTGGVEALGGGISPLGGGGGGMLRRRSNLL